MQSCDVQSLEVPANIGIKDVLSAIRNFMKISCKEEYLNLSPRVDVDCNLYLSLYRTCTQFFNSSSYVIYVFDSAKITSGIMINRDDPYAVTRAKITSQFSNYILETPCNPSNHILLIVSGSI
jgi:hypothetical protein